MGTILCWATRTPMPSASQRGARLKLHRQGNAFVMRIQIMPPNDKFDHHTTMEGGRLLGELGVTQQEDWWMHQASPQDRTQGTA